MNALARSLTLVFACAFISAPASAGPCTLANEVCSDTTPTKEIMGVNVRVSDIGGCWAYQDTYSCVDDGGPDYCAPVAATAGCGVAATTCVARMPDGSCGTWQNTYNCTSPMTSVPATVTQLPTTYTIVRDEYDAVACSAFAGNPSCAMTSETCVDSAPATRNINGLDVTESCWRLQRDYSCVSPSYVNYCSPLTAAGCRESSPPVCTSMAPDGRTCLTNTRTYTCGATQPPNPTVVLLDSSYTVVTDTKDLSACSAYSGNPNCVLASSVCVDSEPATRMVDGFPITKDCWGWANTYACVGDTPQSNCDEFAKDPNCTMQTKVCTNTMGPDAPKPGACDVWETTYKCQTKPATTSTVSDCSGQTYCLDGSCFDTGYTPDSDIAMAAAGLEVGRQMGVYEDPTTHKLFVGSNKQCRNTFADCCKSTGGGGSLSNRVMMDTAMSAAKFGAEQVVKWGSAYVFDYLAETGLSAMLSIGIMDSMADFAMSSPTLNLYGLQFSFSMESGVSFVAFDPYTFALAAAVMIYSKLTSCTQEEQMLGMARGQGLCTRVGSYCKSKTLGVCSKNVGSYCCFNSKLARIINEQGRGQLGLTWGDPASPDCSGFTLAQIEALDFSRIDLSEFIADVVVRSKTNAYGVMRAGATVPSATTKLNSKYVTPH